MRRSSLWRGQREVGVRGMGTDPAIGRASSGCLWGFMVWVLEALVGEFWYCRV